MSNIHSKEAAKVKRLVLFYFSVDWRNSSFTAVMTSDITIESRGVVRFQRVKLNVAPPNFGYDEKLSFYR